VVVAQLSEPIKHRLRTGLVWTPTELAGTDVTELEYQTLGWPHPRRLILIHHRVAERPEAGGKKLLEVPGYVFQALVTSLPPSTPPLDVWRYYNGRADCENVIKEIQQGFALTTLCLHSFWATEAALSLATLTYNLTVLFQRHLGWQTKVTIHALRFWLFITPGLITHPAGKTTIKLAVPPRERDWWSHLWENDPFPVSQLQCSRKPPGLRPLKSNAYCTFPAERDAIARILRIEIQPRSLSTDCSLSPTGSGFLAGLRQGSLKTA
jgi:hypothetical protein